MSLSLQLLPLECASCGAAVEAAAQDVIFYCVACRSGYRLAEHGRGLEPLDVGFLAAPQVAVSRWLPFWLLPTTIHLRTSRTEGIGGLLSRLTGADRDDSEPRFTIPAWRGELRRVLELARRYTMVAPEVSDLIGERLTGGVYDSQDARALAEYLFVDGQICRPGVQTQLEYEIDFHTSRLLGVPFVERDAELVDAYFGLPA